MQWDAPLAGGPADDNQIDVRIDDVLRCPVCGISPLFMSARRTESLSDWFTMLPGCPRCNYVYEREPGYFLFALWLINFGMVTFFGLGLLLLLVWLLYQLLTLWCLQLR